MYTLSRCAHFNLYLPVSRTFSRKCHGFREAVGDLSTSVAPANTVSSLRIELLMFDGHPMQRSTDARRSAQFAGAGPEHDLGLLSSGCPQGSGNLTASRVESARTKRHASCRHRRGNRTFRPDSSNAVACLLGVLQSIRLCLESCTAYSLYCSAATSRTWEFHYSCSAQPC